MEPILSSSLSLCGVAHRTAAFLQEKHLCKPELWQKFVDVYRTRPDGGNYGWRGEYWGKMMRGAVLVCQYTKNEALFAILTDSIRDMLSVEELDGRISSYPEERAFTGWDLWNRKYVMLGMEYYLEICRDEALKGEILSFLCRMADDVLAHIGPGKIEITQASRNWLGLNSSSILEPMVRLHRLTGEQRFLSFSSYIVERGGAEDIPVFRLAYENRLYPYQYGVSKAYEMTSCFEGLLEYYEVTKIEKYKTAVLNFARALLESEISIIGCSGMTHELFDHTATRETVRSGEDEVMQETCVTVTLMKFFSRLLALTGDGIWADAVEKSFYNAYLGALNTEEKESSYPYRAKPELSIVSTNLPFDSYSPLTPGRRGKVTGGFQVLPDQSYYGCCACIGAAGVGVFLQNAVTFSQGCLTVNFYEEGSFRFVCDGVPVTLTVATDYPVDGTVKLTLAAEKPCRFLLKLRNPGWSEFPSGYTVTEKEWTEETVTLSFAMPLRLHFPQYQTEDLIYANNACRVGAYRIPAAVTVYHKPEEEHFVAVTRGPLVLAADSRTGKSADSVFPLPRNGVACQREIVPGSPCLLKMKFEEEGAEPFYLVDYAHAGKDWNTLIAAWLPTAPMPKEIEKEN